MKAAYTAYLSLKVATHVATQLSCNENLLSLNIRQLNPFVFSVIFHDPIRELICALSAFFSIDVFWLASRPELPFCDVKVCSKTEHLSPEPHTGRPIFLGETLQGH